MRFAIYFSPPADAPLTRAAALWLGRDAFTGAPTRPPDAQIGPLVREPARYGFHATLRAPFRLRDGVSRAGLEAVLTEFCLSRQAFSLPPLILKRERGFFALVPETASAPLAGLEHDLLHATEGFRARLDAAAIARRHPERLTANQRAHLERWGYPFVLDEFRFHMTLTGTLGGERESAAEELLRQRFAGFEGEPLAVDRLALFVEEEDGGPFRVAAEFPFGAGPEAQS